MSVGNLGEGAAAYRPISGASPMSGAKAVNRAVAVVTEAGSSRAAADPSLTNEPREHPARWSAPHALPHRQSPAASPAIHPSWMDLGPEAPRQLPWRRPQPPGGWTP